jgi:hypothetical protein
MDSSQDYEVVYLISQEQIRNWYNGRLVSPTMVLVT